MKHLRLWQRACVICFLTLWVCLLALYLYPIVLAAPQYKPAILIQADLTPALGQHTIRILSANLAHGRSDGAHQLRQSREDITKNLDQVAAVFSRCNPDIIALQEADAASWWSGGYNHVQYLAENAAYPDAAHAIHVSGLGLHYGTGIMSQLNILNAWAHTFDMTPPTMSKGFTLAAIQTEFQNGKPLYVAALHTDFASSAARQQQLNYLAQVIEQLDGHCVVVGDFNCAYLDQDSPLPGFMERLGLKTYEANSSDRSLHTFNTLHRRIDWICIPKDWSFQTFQVLPDVVSDHSFIVADIAIGNSLLSP